MRIWLIISLICVPLATFGARPLDCNEGENRRDGVIEVREFECETDESCGVGVWAPLKIEGGDFSGYSAVLNHTGPDEFDLLVSIKHQIIGDEAVVFLYGAKKVLEQVQISTAYWFNYGECPLRSSVRLKHNQVLNSQASPAGTPRSGAH